MHGLPKEGLTKSYYQVIDMLRKKYPVKLLSKTLGCSSSGYYDWIKLGRPIHKAFNEAINEMVKEIYAADDRRGLRNVRMYIKAAYGVILTNRTVYRYMKINDLKATVRVKQRAYPKASNHDIPNVLQRDFTTNKPNEKWSIDISYIFRRDGISYLCAIKDLYDKSIIAWHLSEFIDLKLVLDTLDKAFIKIAYEQRSSLIMHSDQGWHFTHQFYQERLLSEGVIQSISAKGSSVDNSPIESFFAILKTECIYREKQLYKSTIYTVIENYMCYYNNERLQEKIKELAPNQFRTQALQSLFY